MGERVGDVKRRVICGIRIRKLPKIGVLVLITIINVNDVARGSSG
jgi:hypothetical protein